MHAPRELLAQFPAAMFASEGAAPKALSVVAAAPAKDAVQPSYVA